MSNEVSRTEIIGRIRTEDGLVLEVGNHGQRVAIRSSGNTELFGIAETEELVDLLTRAIAQARPPAPVDEDTNLERLVTELAQVFSREDEARMVLRRVGMPEARMPRWDSPGLWWAKVMVDVKNGATRGGTGAVVREALRYYSGNNVFRAAHGVWS